MKNARVFFSKGGACRYISHLDLNRVMLRAIQKSGLAIWRTEGFHEHAYITFALPLSLGFSSTCESVDFRLLNDDEEMDAVPERLNACLPEGIRVVRCCELVFKPAQIDAARYEMRITGEDISIEEIKEAARLLLDSSEINVEKKTKKGMKTVNLKDYLTECEIGDADDAALLTLRLPAGSSVNINPNLFFDALTEKTGKELFCDTMRTNILTKGGEEFA